MLTNEAFVANIGVDSVENELESENRVDQLTVNPTVCKSDFARRCLYWRVMIAKVAKSHVFPWEAGDSFKRYNS